MAAPTSSCLCLDVLKTRTECDGTHTSADVSRIFRAHSIILEAKAKRIETLCARHEARSDRDSSINWDLSRTLAKTGAELEEVRVTNAKLQERLEAQVDRVVALKDELEALRKAIRASGHHKLLPQPRAGS